MKQIIKNILAQKGIEINRYPNIDLKRRLKLLKNFNINKILDVGANKGQYASLLFDLNFGGKIISFEPLSMAYNSLVKLAKKNERWLAENMAIGSNDGNIEINVSENLVSSSILEMLPNHKINSPQSKYINKETVAIRKLDTIFHKYIQEDDIVFLKIDTQGYEKNVLDGADKCLDKISGIQLEMSLVPLYSEEYLFQEMMEHIQSKGFKLYSLENGFSSEKTGQLLQADGIFFRA